MQPSNAKPDQPAALATEADLQSLKSLIIEKHAAAVRWGVGSLVVLVVAVTAILVAGLAWLK